MDISKMLGWIAVVGSPLAIIAVIVAVQLEAESYSLLWRLIWLPIVFLWGLRQIRQTSK